MLCTHHCFQLDVPNIVTRVWMMLCVNSTDSSDDNLMSAFFSAFELRAVTKTNNRTGDPIYLYNFKYINQINL